MNKIIFVGLILFLMMGCTSNRDKQYGAYTSELEQNSATSNFSEGNSIIPKYEYLKDSKIVGPNFIINIKSFDVVEDKSKGTQMIYLLFFVNNDGKDKKSIYCSEFSLIDTMNRTYALESVSKIYNQQTTSGSVQPGLSIWMACGQIMPINNDLKQIEYNPGLFSKNVYFEIFEDSKVKCNVDSDCKEWEVCNQITKRCDLKEGFCNEDLDCNEWKFCSNNTCVVKEDRCEIDSDCGGGQYCDETLYICINA